MGFTRVARGGEVFHPVFAPVHRACEVAGKRGHREFFAIQRDLLAEGAADVYPRLGLTSEWDTAAAHCVVEQAGGSLTDLEMQPLRYNTKDSLLNPFFLVFGDDSRDWSAYL